MEVVEVTEVTMPWQGGLGGVIGQSIGPGGRSQRRAGRWEDRKNSIRPKNNCREEAATEALWTEQGQRHEAFRRKATLDHDSSPPPLLFRAAPTADRSSQASGQTGAVDDGLHHRDNNARSKLHLWPTAACNNARLLSEIRIRGTSSWTRWATMGTPKV